MHRIITISALAMVLLAVGCEPQESDSTKKSVSVQKGTKVYEAEIPLEKILSWESINDIDNYLDHNNPRLISDDLNRTVTSINGKPIFTKDVDQMAIGEEGWTMPGVYNDEQNRISEIAVIFSQRTTKATMHIKRTKDGFEIQMPKDEPTGQKAKGDCVKDKAI